MNQETGELQCTVSYEELAPTGEVLKKTLSRNASLVLMRNEFKDVIFKATLAKKEMKFIIRDIVVHKKFVKDGKATVKFPDKKVQFMISNCPPDQLIMFLKTMSTKFECLKQKGFVSERQKFKSDLPRSLQEISPLTLKDLQTAHGMRTLQSDKGNKINTDPKESLKRKRDEKEKENIPPSQVMRLSKHLLSPASRSVVNPVKLSAEQTRVLNAVQSGKNIFFTGSAGTGKSFLLRRIIGALPPNHTFATASTGVAACHIGGTTLHAFAGIGSGRAPLMQCIELASRNIIAQQWRKCKHLIIDEISMVDGEFFDKMELVARAVRKNNDPFGGIQLILCGDFLQLPPVAKGKEKRRFCFESKAWDKCIDMNMELKQVKRQSDQKFIDILQNIRMGRCPSHVTDILKETARHRIEKDGILATRLCTHKEDVDQINHLHLDKLPGDSKTFHATDSDSAFLKQINNQCPVAHKLVVKEGAQVMLAKNLDVSRGLVNGARGVIVGFDSGVEAHPIVKFACGVKESIKTHRWTFKASGGIYLSRRQLPLKLAWAISIHKSQGMSLDCVEISLSRVFESGQAYVALSRARSLEGLRVLDFDPSCVRSNPTVLRFYHQMNPSRPLKQIKLDRHDSTGNSQESNHW